MGLSGVRPGGAALLGRESDNRRRRARQGLDELLELLGVIRSCEDETELMRLGQEADMILSRVLPDYAKAALHVAALPPHRLALDPPGRSVTAPQLPLPAPSARPHFGTPHLSPQPLLGCLCDPTIPTLP